MRSISVPWAWTNSVTSWRASDVRGWLGSWGNDVGNDVGKLLEDVPVTTMLEIDRFEVTGVGLAELLGMVGLDLVGNLRWRITDLSLEGSPDDVEHVEALLSGLPVSGRRLVAATQTPVTVMSGRFAGYHPNERDPHVTIAAVGYVWQLTADDESILQRVARQTGVR